LNKPRVWLSSPHMGGDEMNFIKEAFDSNWIAPLGPNVDGFEQDLASYHGLKQAAALMSGTSALHLSLITLGVGVDDTVLCQSFTFSATANPIRYVGATPIFIDSEMDSWNMDPSLMEKAIEDGIREGKKPKAVIVVNLYGMPAKLPEIKNICDTYDISLIEDAAESLGSHINSIKTGTFGKVGVLSFNGNKIITTSGGGAAISNDERMIQKFRYLSTQARDPAPHYQHSEIGYNYRMSNIVAGIGRGQMQVLPDRIKQRRANFDFYRTELESFYGVTFLDEPEGYFSNRWLTTMLVDPIKTRGVSREDIRLALEAENIESRPLWKPMHMQPIFKDAPSYLNGVSEKLFEHGLCLPSGSNLTQDDLNRVVQVFKRLLSV
jgi:dTDP-4-amino-4,6-dideoxygalactose transaminase